MECRHRALCVWTLFCAFFSGAKEDSICPLPPKKSVCGKETCPFKTALASHPRAGSTWTRFLLERASGLPCGCEKPDWANVLPHMGEFKEDPMLPNQEGIVTKTHSSCHGCWPEATLHDERNSIARNTSMNPKKVWDAMGRGYLDKLELLGNCLTVLPHSFEMALNRMVRARKEKRWNEMLDRTRIEVPCEFTYDRAIVLIRDPLDVVKSNYHYRTAVLQMRPLNSWSEGNYEFPLERALSFNKFYRTWERFAEAKPTLFVRYEDLRANASGQLRRILDFLRVERVSQEKIDCAIEFSGMDRLKETEADRTRGLKSGANMFFGSRGQTEEREKLEYPAWLIDRFESEGLFELSSRYGYPPRPAPTGLDGDTIRPPRFGKAGKMGKMGKSGKGKGVPRGKYSGQKHEL